jgi:hypothetical protein
LSAGEEVIESGDRALTVGVVSFGEAPLQQTANYKLTQDLFDWYVSFWKYLLP